MNLVERPVISLGQYEAVFKHYIFIKKMWTHKGKCQIVPKEEGYGIMILAFQPRQFGFGYPLTAPDIQNITEYHAFHPKYVDTYTETIILGHTHK